MLGTEFVDFENMFTLGKSVLDHFEEHFLPKTSTEIRNIGEPQNQWVPTKYEQLMDMNKNKWKFVWYIPA